MLYLTDPIDEFIVNDIYNFDGKTLKSVVQEDLDLGELGKDEKDIKKKAESKYKKLTERIKNILGDAIKEVQITTRLKDSPACLVADKNGMGVHMEKLMKAMGHEVPKSQRILEINGTSASINMNARYEKIPGS